MKFTALTRLERNVHLVVEIVGVLAKYGLAGCVKGLKSRIEFKALMVHVV